MFNVGDKVQVKKKFEKGFKQFINKTGIIIDINDDSEYPINVQFDTDSCVFYTKELTKRLTKVHVCGLVCKKCNPRDMINF